MQNIASGTKWICMCVCTHIHIYVFTLKIHWLIIGVIFHLWISWILTIDFHTVRMSSSNHMLLFVPEVICQRCQGCAGNTLEGIMMILDVGLLLSPGKGLMDVQSPLKQPVLMVLQLQNHSGAQPLLAGATVPKNQGTKPGEGERWQILGQRGHFWPGLLSHVANEATQCYIRRESATNSRRLRRCFLEITNHS